jgi:hypothetical protein
MMDLADPGAREVTGVEASPAPVLISRRATA